MRLLKDVEADLLALLGRRGRLHGYDIGRELTSARGRDVGPGTYYRWLHKLERDGYIVGEWESDGEAAGHQGPRRRFYRLDAEASGEALAAYRQWHLNRAGGALGGAT